MAADPQINGNGRYVPLSLYLEDRRELRAWMGQIADDVEAIRRELDLGAGRSEVQAAQRKTRSERTWDVIRTGIAAVVGAVAAFFTGNA